MNYKKVYKRLEELRGEIPSDLNPPEHKEFNETPIYELADCDIGEGLSDFFMDGLFLPNPITRFFDQSEKGFLFVGVFWEVRPGFFNLAICGTGHTSVFASIEESFPNPIVKIYEDRNPEQPADCISLSFALIMGLYVVRSNGPVVEKGCINSRHVKWYKKAQWRTVVKLGESKNERGENILSGIIKSKNKQLYRAAHWRSGHKRVFKSERFKKTFTWVKGHYCGPDEFQHNGQIYKVVR